MCIYNMYIIQIFKGSNKNRFEKEMFPKQRITIYPGGFLFCLEFGCRQHSGPRFIDKPKGIEIDELAECGEAFER